MEFKIGDKVELIHSSYSFGFKNEECVYGAPHRHLRVIYADLLVTAFSSDHYKKGHPFYKVNDLAVVDKDGIIWFVQSRFCKLTDKKIELRYFVDGRDVTDNISDETKRNLTRN